MIPVLAFVALVVAFALGYLLGRARRAPVDVASATPPRVDDARIEVDTSTIVATPPSTEAGAIAPTGTPDAPESSIARSSADAPAPEPPGEAAAQAANEAATVAERARILRSIESEASALRGALAADRAEIARLAALAAERARLEDELAGARSDAARYRQFVVDLENNAPPPLLGGPGAPDDLKLIVGIGPVLERMLFQLGITTYRQIGRWNERDIDEIDAKLPEFPGRIRRDGWVTQARALHQSKYGAALPPRDRS